MSFLKYIRIIVALALFLPITLFFVDFLGWFPLRMHEILHYQVIPAALRANVAILLILLVMTLLLGRIYCSTLCPLGVLQDFFFRMSKPFLKDKNKSRRKKKAKLEEYQQGGFLSRLRIYMLKRNFYAMPNNWLRYSFLAISIIGLLAAGTGAALALDILDPYSNYGRIASNLFRPLTILVNNEIAGVLNGMGNYSVFKVKITTIEWITFIFSSVVLFIVFVLSFTRGRLYCNTICPVGSFLGILSRFSFFKIRFNVESCTSCGLCEFKCKSQCINSETKEVDNDRCVACFDCLETCKHSGIGFSFALPLSKPTIDQPKEANQGRRAFLTTTGTLAVAAASAQRNRIRKRAGGGNCSNTKYYSKKPIMPPGAINLDRFLDKCTACQLCVTKCPSHVLKPALTQYGWDGIMHPMMDFSHGFCNYDCTDCCSVCPNDALIELTKEEKRLTQVGLVQLELHRCVVVTDETSCGACSEHCPTQAVHMIEYKDGLTIPSIKPEICIGCGGCESICPVRPATAIFVDGNTVQILAEKPKEEEVVIEKADDFGF